MRILRQTMTEHRAAMDEIERTFEQRIQPIRAEADTLKAEETPPSERQRLMERAVTIGAPIIRLIAGIALGVLDMQGKVAKRLRKRSP